MAEMEILLQFQLLFKMDFSSFSGPEEPRSIEPGYAAPTSGFCFPDDRETVLPDMSPDQFSSSLPSLKYHWKLGKFLQPTEKESPK